MAYETGSSTGASDLLGKINTFAVANGWTSNRNTSTDVCVSKGSLYENINWNEVSTISLKAATGFDGGAEYTAQPGQSLLTQKVINIPTLFTAYHLFTNATGDYIHCVILVSPNQCRHLCFGKMDTQAAGTIGGEYSATTYHKTTHSHSHGETLRLFGSSANNLDTERYYCSTIRASYDDVSNTWLTVNNIVYNADLRAVGTDSTFLGSTQIYTLYRDWIYLAGESDQGIQVFNPIVVYVDRTNSLWSQLGIIRDLRCCNIKFYSPGQEVTIDAETWIVFPVTAKGDGTALSGNYGYAYRKIV